VHSRALKALARSSKPWILARSTADPQSLAERLQKSCLESCCCDREALPVSWLIKSLYMDNDVASMRRQSRQQRGVRLHSHILRHLPTPPTEKSPAYCAADYFRNGCRTSARTHGSPNRELRSGGARSSFLFCPIAMCPAAELAGIASHLHSWCQSATTPRIKLRATQSSERIMREQNTNAGPRKRVIKKSNAVQRSVCFFVLSLPYLPTCRARVDIVYLLAHTR